MAANTLKREERIGQQRTNSKNECATCIEYINSDNIIIMFDNDKTIHTTWYNFEKGSFRNPLTKNSFNAIVGEKYKVSVQGKTLYEYREWKNMLVRTMYEDYKIKYQSYETATCCEKWLNYENFYEWIHSRENFSNLCDNQIKWCLDKDILNKGNKHYSPENCELVPSKVNSLFIKANAKRGDLPIGVSLKKGTKTPRYVATCRDPYLLKQKHLGYYSTPEEAFKAYKSYKEKLIKQVAEEEYAAGNITQRCYEAMMKYQVEITD